jgi:signal transduction histidine kinase
MRDLSLHIMDLAENSMRAGASTVSVRVEEDRGRDRLTLVIEDDGKGMDGRALEAALDPFYSTKPGRRTGLGLPLLAQAAREAGGNLTIDSEPGRGTRVDAVFALSHADLKPLGDMERTIRLLGFAHPKVDFRYSHTVVREQGDAHEARAARS